MFGDSLEQDLEFITLIHDQIIEESGGLKGYRDKKLIESALGRPLQSAFGRYVYRNIFRRAAALLDSIANNHGFTDGNKRTAMAAAIFYLSLYSVTVSLTNEEYEVFMLQVVNGKPGVKEIADWLRQHSDALMGIRRKFNDPDFVINFSSAETVVVSQTTSAIRPVKDWLQVTNKQRPKM